MCTLVGPLELALTRQAAASTEAAQVGLSAPLRRGTPGTHQALVIMKVNLM